MKEIIFGIDLGTTNSEIAWTDADGHAQVVSYQGETIMPSVVGVDAGGSLLIGTPARNQYAAFPERTVRSVKRSMGTDKVFELGEHRLGAAEVSALILKELARRASRVCGVRVRKVVITVPAFFQDAQRQATRLAGEIAQLEVVRIVNEPTAAALAYEGFEAGPERQLLVFDLGGGTFDVSLVRADGEMTEVLASHGDVHLGGDDFDQLLMEEFAERFVAGGSPDPRSFPEAGARLLDTAERAKRRLTEEVSTHVREEFLVKDPRGEPHHLDLCVTREAFESRTSHLLERCLDSIHRALESAGMKAADLDAILLVGGATRMPMVAARLTQVSCLEPRHDLHADLCVAQGAALLGARLAGREVRRVLLDITPYTFGVRALDITPFDLDHDHFAPVIERNIPLPVTRSVPFETFYDNQTAWDVQVFQGESSDVKENILVGRFMASGFSKVRRGNEIVCRMHLDLDGLLTVDAIETRTGQSTRATIEGVTKQVDDAALAEARKRTAALWGEVQPELDSEQGLATSAEIEAPLEAGSEAGTAPLDDTEGLAALLAKGRKLKPRMADEDREDFERLEAGLLAASGQGDSTNTKELLSELSDLIYYVEGT